MFSGQMLVYFKLTMSKSTNLGLQIQIYKCKSKYNYQNLMVSQNSKVTVKCGQSYFQLYFLYIIN